MAAHSVVEVVSDDMPFLVDSVTAELSRHGRAIHLVIHPSSWCAATSPATLLEVCDATSLEDAGDDCQDAVVESWMHVEIDRETDDEQRDRAGRRPRAGAARRPRGGRGLAARCSASPSQVADERRRQRRRPACPRAGGRRGRASCSAGWPTRTSPSSATASTSWSPSRTGRRPAGRRPGHRARHPARRPAPGRRLRPAAAGGERARARAAAAGDHQGQQPLHRAPAGLPRLRRRQDVRRPGEVVGERRFLGLFTSAAYNESIQRIPVLRRKAAEVLARSGFTRQQPLRQGPAADPGDLPARRAVPDRRRRPRSTSS